jgi:cytochrome c oxidase assembly protein subunit 15
MSLTNILRTLSIVSLVCIFLVILAGSVVRMTGSGMGCPDWPKCYGYLVPPSDPAVLQYQAGHNYDKSQMVILNDTLWVANEKMVSAPTFDHAQWHKYPKHNYARFDARETWTEYINRLLGAFSGLPVLLLFLLSIVHMVRFKDVLTFLLATGVLLMLGFEAWLGKVVVDDQLKVSSITLHMFGSMAIVALLVALIYRLGKKELFAAFPLKWKLLAGGLLVLSILQVFLGTQVREEVDAVAQATSDRSQWIALLPVIFKVHRSFSILVVLLTYVLYQWNKKLFLPLLAAKGLVLLVMLEVTAGIVLAYFDMPKFMQPLHLLAAIGMFGFSFYIVMVVYRRVVVV